LIYVLAVESSLVLSRIFIDWGAEHPQFPASLTRYWNDVPTIMIFFGHPISCSMPRAFRLTSTPIRTIESAQEAVCSDWLEKAPCRVSPVNAFAGAPDAKY